MSKALTMGLALAGFAVTVLVLPHVAQASHGMGATNRTVVVDVVMAYVDPGVAGFVVVSVLGFISAIGYTFRTYIGRLKRFVLGDRQGATSENEERARQ